MSAPWMPLYIADYLADTAHLSAAEHGAYLLLIMHYWRAGKLPTDERQLQRIARMSAREWANSRDTLAAFFDAEWRHRRIEIELAKSVSKSTARAESGSRGGKAKALKDNNARLANAINLPEQKPAVDMASSSQSHIYPSSLRSDGAETAQPVDIAPDFRTELFRRGLSEVVKATGIPEPKSRTLIGQWLKMADDEAVTVLAMIDEAVAARPADFVPWVRRGIEFRMRGRGTARAGPPHEPSRQMRGSAALNAALDRILPDAPHDQAIPHGPVLSLSRAG